MHRLPVADKRFPSGEISCKLYAYETTFPNYVGFCQLLSGTRDRCAMRTYVRADTCVSYVRAYVHLYTRDAYKYTYIYVDTRARRIIVRARTRDDAQRSQIYWHAR